MEINFANNRIQKVCSSLREMRKNLGDVRARNLVIRFKQIRDAACLELLRNAAGNWHELSQDRKGQIAVNVGQPYR